MVSSLIFESVTNMLNLSKLIERSWSEKHFKPIFYIWEGYKVDFFQPYPGGLFEEGVYSRGGSVRVFRVSKKYINHNEDLDINSTINNHLRIKRITSKIVRRFRQTYELNVVVQRQKRKIHRITIGNFQKLDLIIQLKANRINSFYVISETNYPKNRLVFRHSYLLRGERGKKREKKQVSSHFI